MKPILEYIEKISVQLNESRAIHKLRLDAWEILEDRGWSSDSQTVEVIKRSVDSFFTLKEQSSSSDLMSQSLVSSTFRALKKQWEAFGIRMAQVGYEQVEGFDFPPLENCKDFQLLKIVFHVGGLWINFEDQAVSSPWPLQLDGMVGGPRPPVTLNVVNMSDNSTLDIVDGCARSRGVQYPWLGVLNLVNGAANAKINVHSLQDLGEGTESHIQTVIRNGSNFLYSGLVAELGSRASYRSWEVESASHKELQNATLSLRILSRQAEEHQCFEIFGSGVTGLMGSQWMDASVARSISTDDRGLMGMHMQQVTGEWEQVPRSDIEKFLRGAPDDFSVDVKLALDK